MHVDKKDNKLPEAREEWGPLMKISDQLTAEYVRFLGNRGNPFKKDPAGNNEPYREVCVCVWFYLACCCMQGRRG